MSITEVRFDSLAAVRPETDLQLGRTLSGPEHQVARLPTVKALLAAGWTPDQLQWQPEWRVPKSPHDAAKREGGKSFAGWPVDLVLFDRPGGYQTWEHVVAICEFKAPSLDEGISQLEIYLNREPRARMGYWTNGTSDVRVYRLPNGTFKHRRGAGLPRPDETFEQQSEKPLTYPDLMLPSQNRLKAVFEALLDVIVARDSLSTRSEGQLNEICNLLLVKLESDDVGADEPSKPLAFQLNGDEAQTAAAVRAQYKELISRRPEIFGDEVSDRILLDDHSIHQVVYELSGLDLLRVRPEAISSAFQVFRRANLKAGEGQYFTPAPVIEAAVRLMDITRNDRVIDPACGTGGFLTEAFLHVLRKSSGSDAQARARTWAHRDLYGVDKDSTNVKLARAILMSMGDGSVNVNLGDSIRQDRWATDYPHLTVPLKDGSFSVVLTNPPFGKNLKVSARDTRNNEYTIAQKAGKPTEFHELEIGLVFLERSYRLLQVGGRLGIVLPETYFFSSSYKWIPVWLASRFTLRGVVNIPMEAFQGFCRAKTNFYIFEKRA